MDNEKNTELGTMPVGRLMFKLALPAIVAQVINALYNIVDRMYIGHIEGVGPMALTGVGMDHLSHYYADYSLCGDDRYGGRASGSHSSWRKEPG